MFYLSRNLYGLTYSSITGDSKMIKQESQTNDETQLNSKKPTITGSQIDCLVGLPKFTKIMIADDPHYYDEKYFPDWETKNISCVGVTEDFKEVLIPKNFSRRCHASRFVKKHFPEIEIQQWYY